ncbi:unnamed protein product [Meganyctiphanes norvegica]|uniref:Uncharacterized protein n=1 Tax=Meganyctiphanes norvegica TaxID=48144 RepID=A0AAV2QVL7_MEGNR
MALIESSVCTMVPDSKDFTCPETTATDPSTNDTSVDRAIRMWTSVFARCSTGHTWTPMSTLSTQEKQEESVRLEAHNAQLREILKDIRAKKDRIVALMPGFLADARARAQSELIE